MPQGALAGMRVVDLTDDSGRFATKLLTEMGADVVRITDRGSPGAEMRSPTVGARGGVLDWWYDGGKRRHLIDLASDSGRESYRRLAASADLIVDTMTPGRLAELGIDHTHLIAENPRLTQVSITPFGATGPRAHWSTSDLVSAAMGGFLSVTGLPDRPLNVWGRQAYNYAGFIGAISGLAGVRAARTDGTGRSFDVSIHESLTGSVENIFMQWFFDDLLPLPKLAERQGALHWLRAYDLAKASSGYVMITPTPSPELLVDWMVRKGHEPAAEWAGLDVEAVLERIDDLMDCIRGFVAQHDAMELWWEAQSEHCAFGGVHDIGAVAEIPQFAHRGFWAEATAIDRGEGDSGEGDSGEGDAGEGDAGEGDAGEGDAGEGDTDTQTVRQPRAMVQFSATPTRIPGAPADADTDLDQLLSEWGSTTSTHSEDERLHKPLSGLRVADFTWVLAGPFCTRMLGDLGADVIRIQNEERSTLVNRPDYPYYFVWNRSKRSATLNMKHPDALAAARRLIEQCDVLIENYSAGVLDSWGLDWETVHEWNPRLVYVTMSGCGHDGPWRHVISYAPTVHAVCGITHLTNFEDRGDIGSGFSLNDHLAGFSAAVTTLAALEARDRTGEGQKIDMAQLEVGTYSIGPALVDHFANGANPGPHGNRDGLHDHVPNEVYPCADGFLAVTATDDSQWAALATAVGDPLHDPSLATEAERRARRSEIDDALTSWCASRTADEAMATLQDRGVPAGKVQDAGDLYERDPQHDARGFWNSCEHDGFGDRATDTFPALVDGQRLAVERLSPAYLGEHNFDVWTEVAGYDFGEVAEGIGGELFS